MSQIELLEPVFTLEEIQDIVGKDFEIILLSSSVTPEGYRVKYFPLDTLVEDKGVSEVTLVSKSLIYRNDLHRSRKHLLSLWNTN